MVRRLTSEGVRVRAWNRTRVKAEQLPVEVEKSPAVLVTSVEPLTLIRTEICSDRGIRKGREIGLEA